MFPNGILHYIIGGALIGISLASIYILTGIQAGSSGWLSAIWCKITKSEYGASLSWRTIFTITTIVGGFTYAVIFNDFFITGVSWYKLFIGGFLVGIGTRVGLGCTSGHGICGIGALHKSSIYFILIFMAVAILTRMLV